METNTHVEKLIDLLNQIKLNKDKHWGSFSDSRASGTHKKREIETQYQLEGIEECSKYVENFERFENPSLDVIIGEMRMLLKEGTFDNGEKFVTETRFDQIKQGYINRWIKKLKEYSDKK